MEYLNAKQIIGRLKQGRVADISEAYFSQLVRDGYIPQHTLPGKKRKHYLYDEVKQALADIQDPTRDAQRGANAERREEKYRDQLGVEKKVLDEKYRSALDLIDVNISQIQEKTGFSGIVLKALECDLNEARMLNQNLTDIVRKEKEFIATMPLDKAMGEHLMFGVLKIIIETMTTVDEFNQMVEDFYSEEDIAEIEREG